MIIGVPFFAVLYAMIKRMTNTMLKKKGLPSETSKYMNVDHIQDKDIFIQKNTERKNKNLFSMFSKKSLGREAKETVQEEEKSSTFSNKN